MKKMIVAVPRLQIIIIFEVFFEHNSMSFWSSELKFWGPTRLCRLFQGTKEDFVKNRFFGFSGGFFSVFYNNYYYF